MIRLLVILALGLSVGHAQNRNDEIHLKATVRAVIVLSDFSGTITPVHFDPLFALTVRIESANPAISNFRPGSLVTFAIHSPAQLFPGEGEAVKGKTYDFVLHRTIENGKVRFFGLQLQRP
ncbi:MAG TPA: hypothetical protein VJA94_21555 [Candidatus Angelobacter sp.]